MDTVASIERLFVEDLTLVTPSRQLLRRGEMVLETTGQGGQLVEVFLFNDIMLVGALDPSGKARYRFMSALQMDASLVKVNVTAETWVELTQVGGAGVTIVLHGTVTADSIEWANAFENVVFGREEAAIRAQLAEGERRLAQLASTKDRIVRTVQTSARSSLTAAQQRTASLEDDLAKLQRPLGTPGAPASTIEGLRAKTEAMERDLALVTTRVEERESESRGIESAIVAAERAHDAQMEPLRAVVARLKEEEEEMRRELVSSGKLPLLQEFLTQKNALLAQEATLRDELQRKESELSSARLALCEVDMSAVPPEDKEKAKLYIEWKRVQYRQNEAERKRREEAHSALAHARSEGERDAILRELQKRAEIFALETAEANFKREAQNSRERTVELEAGLTEAAHEMRSLRKEFEQMRTALVLDKTIKDSQVATLTEHRARLEQAEASFDASLEVERKSVEAEMEAVWGPRLATARRESAAKIESERAKMELKMATLRTTLEQRYRDGFAPLLREAEARLAGENQRTESLRAQLTAQENELRSLESEMGAFERSALRRGGGGGEPRVDVEEIRRVQGQLRALWEQLETPPEEIARFLADLDLVDSDALDVVQVYTAATKRLGQT